MYAYRIVYMYLVFILIVNPVSYLARDHRHEEGVCEVYQSRAAHAAQLGVYGHAAIDRPDT